jgi:hypothetical protein
MKRAFIQTVLAAVVLSAAIAARAAAQPVPADEQQALRSRIEQRYDVVVLTNGVALTPKSPRGDVRLIEISDTIAVNGVQVSGRELRERVGADADSILRLSYLDRSDLRRMFSRSEPDLRLEKDAPVERATPAAPSPTEPPSAPLRRSRGDRVRVFGSVAVDEGEAIDGQVVAVMGSARVDGEVRDQVVAVLGSVDLGPHAVVHGDVVSVGGRVRKAEGARVLGSETEVSPGGIGPQVRVPWARDWGPFAFGPFGALARLIGTAFRLVLLALVCGLALVVARRAVEGSAQRVADDPLRSTLVGLVAWALFVPVFVIAAVVLSISIIGIPLLILLPFAALVLVLMAIVGFSGTASAVGQWTRRRFGMATPSGFADVCIGIVVILLPVLVGRVVALAGWTVSPIVFLFVAMGVAVEFLAWSSGFGAVLTNAFSRWQAKRAARVSTPV